MSKQTKNYGGQPHQCCVGHGRSRDSAFILGRERWLNMTGRKWESEAGDASRYCQITRRMRQISLFLHLVLVISLASFSSLIPLVWRYVAGGLINLALTVKRNCLKQQCHSKLSLSGYRWIWERTLLEKNSEPFHAVLCYNENIYN